MYRASLALVITMVLIWCHLIWNWDEWKVELTGANLVEKLHPGLENTMVSDKADHKIQSFNRLQIRTL
jgi:hypothetical protein